VRLGDKGRPQPCSDEQAGRHRAPPPGERGLVGIPRWWPTGWPESDFHSDLGSSTLSDAPGAPGQVADHVPEVQVHQRYPTRLTSWPNTCGVAERCLGGSSSSTDASRLASHDANHQLQMAIESAHEPAAILHWL